jgi:hypothetical protein
MIHGMAWDLHFRGENPLVKGDMMKAVPVAILICDTCSHNSQCDAFPDRHNLCSCYAEIEDVSVLVSLKTDSEPAENSVDDGFLCLLP